MTTYEKHLCEPWFTLVAIGLKKGEGRLDRGDFSKMQPNDIIIFHNSDLGFKRTCKVQIYHIRKYENMQSLIQKENLDILLPSVKNQEDATKIYQNIYKNDFDKYAAIALKIGKIF